MQHCNPTNIPVEFGLKLTKAGSGKKTDSTFYKKIVGSLMYLTATRPDIMNGEKADLIGFTDSDYAGDQDGRKSTSGYVFILGTGAVSWSSKKQTVVTLSSTEAEFVASIACACQAIWLWRILKELQFKMESATMIFCDNNSSIKLSKNPVNHGRSNHIDV
ncbi:secreted RxLR effector protein 161-like, partial [Capsicum annuum]|uniref:secreted RxLR effector protein 161-like n=1 Tax=Capsicum annuum TaxID=4072 RepID=UPI001FB17B73